MKTRFGNWGSDLQVRHEPVVFYQALLVSTRIVSELVIPSEARNLLFSGANKTLLMQVSIAADELVFQLPRKLVKAPQ